ncbi:hypothetical protein BASA81_000292 [Batrachochytrium salamandrivorans]|nr:hypothetical protein BASA81_000292 [Batrachochytrium salamandrivorans]
MPKKSVVLCSSSQSVGVGLSQSPDESFWFVSSVEEGSLACTAQVLPGDMLHSINFIEVKTEVEIERELSQRPPVVLQFVSPESPASMEVEESYPLFVVEGDQGKPPPSESTQEEEEEETLPAPKTTTRLAQTKQDLVRVGDWLTELTASPVSLAHDRQHARPLVFFTTAAAAAEKGEEEIVACCIGHLLKTPLRGGGMLLIQDLVAAPPRKGEEVRVGKELFAFVVDHAKQRGCSEVQLTSELSASEAHRFFIHQGMDIAGFSLRLLL